MMRCRLQSIPPSLIALVLLAGCATARQPDPREGRVVDHPMHTPTLVTMMMHDAQLRALQDSAIMRVVGASVHRWNEADLEGFLAAYDRGATYETPSGSTDARDAIRRIHTARWMGGGSHSARLSVRVLRSETLTADLRLLHLAWTVTDAATGREETWTSSLTVRRRPDAWRIVHEQSSLDG